MKIGVLTFHRCINYGSYWQARAFVDDLRARGHDAVLLDHTSRRVDHAEWKCALRPVLPAPTPKADYPLYRRKIEKFFCAFSSLPLSPPFDLENPAAMEEYDTVFVGSDEVWNLMHPWYGGCPLFYGVGIRAQRLASYAASFGNYPAAWGLGSPWSDRLREFDFISVRDDNARWIVKNALGIEPDMALDPCLQFPIKPEGAWTGPDYPFVAVYGHNFSPAFQREVCRWAESQGLPLVSVGYRNDWADVQWIDAGPHEFAQAIARAQAVATNFFHGCVFALRNARPLVCEVCPYRTIKIQCLLQTVGGERHLVTEDTPAHTYDALLSAPPGADILQRIDCLRRATEAYLERALA